MDILKLLEEMDEIVNESSTIPLSGKIMLNKREILELIDEIKIKLPDELKQAEWIKEERLRILSEAQNDADTMLKEVQVHIESMVDNHEIVTEAERRGEEILERAQMSAKEVRLGANEYADGILEEVVESLQQTENRVNETIDMIQTNRAELNEDN